MRGHRGLQQLAEGVETWRETRDQASQVTGGGEGGDSEKPRPLKANTLPLIPGFCRLNASTPQQFRATHHVRDRRSGAKTK